jgi:hypothetical protein
MLQSIGQYWLKSHMRANFLFTMTTLFRNVFLILTISLPNFIFMETSVAADTTENRIVSKNVTSIAPQKILENIKAAVEHDTFLNNDFYTLENLHDFFGEPYTIKPLLIPKELNIRVLSFDSAPSADDDQSKVASGQRKVLPVFNNGKIYLTDLSGNQVTAHFVIVVNVATVKPDLLDANLIQQVFGKPTSVTSAKPPASKDDKPEQEVKATSPLGNSYLNYQTEQGDIFRNILFKTAGDGAVIEVQIYVGKKQ